MSIFNVLGNVLVSNDEIVEKAATGKFIQFESALSAGQAARIDFSNGALTKESLSAATVPFKPIGLGKPLAIEIRHVYTGGTQKQGRKKKMDLLVTTALKSGVQSKKAPRAVNHLKKEVTQNQNISTPAASDIGQQLVYYSKAEVQEKIILDIEQTFDRFNQQFYEDMADVFAEAAGLPVFATASAYLITGSIITRIAGRLGEIIFDGDPFFNQTEEIRLFEPGMPVTRPGYKVIFPNDVEEEVLKDYELGAEEYLVHKSNKKKYEGIHPYVVISLDGTSRGEEYEKFKPSLASAELLDRFFNVKQDQTKPFNDVIGILEASNDLTWRKKAEKMKIKMAQTDLTPEEKEKYETLYNAYIANISNELMKP